MTIAKVMICVMCGHSELHGVVMKKTFYPR